MKICSKCDIEKELSEFNKHPKNIDKLNSYCKICQKEYNKQWYLNNQEKYKEKSKQHYLNNKEIIKEYYKQYLLNNKEHYKEYQKQYNKQRKQNDPLFKLFCNIRTLLSASFRNKGIRKNTKTEQILGCTIEEFKIHIEKQFLHPMSLENHGLIWEIDHITPISLAKTEEDIIILNHYTNLRPLFKTTEIAEQCGHNIVGNRNKGASSLVS
jgi:hypothetical protein